MVPLELVLCVILGVTAAAAAIPGVIIMVTLAHGEGAAGPIQHGKAYLWV